MSSKQIVTATAPTKEEIESTVEYIYFVKATKDLEEAGINLRNKVESMIDISVSKKD